MATPTAFTPEIVAYGVEQLSGWSGETLQFIGLGVIDLTIYVPTAFTPELLMLAVQDSHPTPETVPNIEQFIVMAVYGTGEPEDFRLRAWGFTMDGHRFYVLHLGQEGTFVYDFTSGQWSEWKTEGYIGWNAHVGMNWGSDDRIIAADIQNPIVWEIDPDRFTDEGFRDITRVVTAIIPQSGYGWKQHNSVQIIASVGDPSNIAPFSSPTINLTYSDDQGATYDGPADATVVLVAGEYGQQIDWQALGSFRAPGRVINITDYGAVARIDRATTETD